jgi:hypothetical protein
VLAITITLVLAACSADGDRSLTPAATTHHVVTATSGRRTWPGRPDAIIFEDGTGERARIVQLDPGNGDERVISEDRPAHVPDLNLDGSRLAWAGPSATDPTWPDVFVRNIATNRWGRVGSGAQPTWTYDQTALLVGRKDGLYRLELDGSAKRVVKGVRAGGREIEPGVFVVNDYEDTPGSSKDQLLILRGGHRTSVFRRKGCSPQAWDLNIDGRSLLYNVACTDRRDSKNGLHVYDMKTRTSKQILEAPAAGASRSPDGTSIVTVYQSSPDGTRAELWILDADGHHRVVRRGTMSWPVWRALPLR